MAACALKIIICFFHKGYGRNGSWGGTLQGRLPGPCTQQQSLSSLSSLHPLTCELHPRSGPDMNYITCAFCLCRPKVGPTWWWTWQLSPTAFSCFICVLRGCTLAAEDAAHASFISCLAPVSSSLAEHPALAAPRQSAQAISSLPPAPRSLATGMCTSFSSESPMAQGWSPNLAGERSQPTHQVTQLFPKASHT